MSTTMTLTDLILASRQRADMVNSTFVSDSELTSYINQSYFELYDLLVQKYGDNYYVAPPVTITTDGTNDQYSLPDGTLYSSALAFYKLLGVDLMLQPGQANTALPLKQFDFAERNNFTNPVLPFPYGRTIKYRLNGSKLWLRPLPTANMVLQLWYVPRLTQLVTGSDTVDGISGWTEYIIIDAAIKCLQKEESDVSILALQKGEIIKRIEAAAENRDAANPATVADVMSSGYYGGGQGYGDSY